MSRHMAWLAGRGVSMSCGLDWNVPPALEAAFRDRTLSRFQLKARICDELSRAQDDPSIDCRPLLSLASGLDKALVSRLAGKRGGRWLVVNHDAAEVRRAREELRRRLPGCSVQAVELPFDEWVRARFPGLNIAGERAA